jgi:cytochrome c-type biogenesis protein CcmH
MFWIFALLLILFALAIILPPLFKKTPLDTNDRYDQNIQIAKEQLNELETAFGNHEMQQEEYLSRRDELEQSLYSDTKTGDAKPTEYTKPSIVSTLLIASLIPAIAFGMYTRYGNSQAVDPETIKTTKNIPMTADGKPDVDAMVSGLRQKLDAKPNNPQGWYMLGRSYMALKRYNDATYSYEQLLKLQPEDAKTMLFLADAESMKNNGDVSGRPTTLIEKSLEIEPNNTTGLWLGGMSSSRQGKHEQAIQRWTSLLPLLKNQPEQIAEIHKLIANAKQKMSPKTIASLPTTSNSSPKITQETTTQAPSDVEANSIVVTVSLSNEMKNKAKPTDTVFIYAKAMSGPPMPLAAKRIQVKDLPITITLDDSSAMIPAMKLSAFPQVILGARVSKTGNAIGANGDLYTEKQSINIGSKQTLIIDSILQK